MLHQKISPSWGLTARAQCSVEYIGALSHAAQLALDEVLIIARDVGANSDVHLAQTLLHLLDEQVRQLSKDLEVIVTGATAAEALAA